MTRGGAHRRRRRRRPTMQATAVVLVGGLVSGALAWSTSASFGGATATAARVATLLPVDLADGTGETSLDVPTPRDPLPNQRCIVITPVAPVPQQLRAYGRGRTAGDTTLQVQLEFGTTKAPYDCKHWKKIGADIYNSRWDGFLISYYDWAHSAYAGKVTTALEEHALRVTVSRAAGAPLSASGRITVVMEARPCGSGTPIPTC